MKHWVQIATIGTTLTLATLASAQDDVAPRAVVMPPDPPRDAPREAPTPSPPAVGGEGTWVFDLLGGQLGGPTGALGSSTALGGIGFLGPFSISTLSSEMDLSGNHSTYKSTVFALTPSADVFVTERFSVGAQLGAGIISSSTTQAQGATVPGSPPSPDFSSSTRGYTVGIAPRVGYVVPLSSSVALWPRIGGGYEVSRQMVDDADGRTIMRTWFTEASFGVGVRVAKHVLFDVGPVLHYRRLSSEASPGTASLYGSVVPGSTESFGASLRAALRLDL